MRRVWSGRGFALLAAAVLVAFADDPVDDPVVTRRAARIAADRAALEAELQQIAAFRHQDEFAAALQKVHDDANARKWWPVDDGGCNTGNGNNGGSDSGGNHGAVPMVTVERWLTWSRPRAVRADPPAVPLTVPLAADIAAEGHPGAAIIDLARQLNAHGIEFLYVSFPTRIEIDPALVVPGIATEGAPFRGMVDANTRFLLELSKASVEVLNLAPLFVENRDLGVAEADARRRLLYHRWNMHWTPRAIEIAAEQIAARLAQMPWFRHGPYKEHKAFNVRPKSIEFSAEGNGQAPDSPSEPIAMQCVQMQGAVLQKETKQKGPIVLLGDSFVNMHKDYGAAVHDHLFRHTGWPIDVIAPPGGAELQCRETLRLRGDNLAGKKVVIWLMQDAALEPSTQFRPVQLFGE